MTLSTLLPHALKGLLYSIALCGLVGNAHAQCTTWVNPNTTGGWTDFNTTFGGAPCDDGTGCPFNEITAFEIFADEAYAMDDIAMGGTYTFSACNGVGGTAWNIEYTIVAPSGTVDASGLDAGSNCALTWTASEAGTYLIVVSEVGACGTSTNDATNNGFPAITCVSSPATDCSGGTMGCTTWVNPNSTGGWTDFNTTFGGAPCDDGTGCPFNEITAFEIFADEAYAMDDIAMGGTYTFSACNGVGGTAWNIEYTIIAPSGAVDATGLDAGSNCALTWTASEAGTYLIVISEVGACGTSTNDATNNGFPAITCVSSPATDCSGGTMGCTTWINPTPPGGWTNFNTQFGGAPCDDGTGCPFNEITTFEVFADEAYLMDNVAMGGTYTFSACNGTGGAGTGGTTWNMEFTIIAPSGAVDATGLDVGSNCELTWTASEDGTYTIVVSEVGACGTSTNDATNNGFPAITCVSSPATDCSGGTMGCTTWVNPNSTGGWTDFNTTFGGAPCDDGTGCPFNEITAFEIFADEAYAMDDIAMGGTYTFSACNGVGGTAWNIEYTIIAPSGAVDATGLDAGSNCALTWTASEAGTYLIVISEVGACGTSTNDATNNGFPAITCVSSPATDCSGGTMGCTTWINPTDTTGWVDFNTTFGGAPCDDGTGCPFNELNTFEIWADEAYAMDNVAMGGTYTFSACNGTGGTAWNIEFTIIAPSGAVDATGLDAGSNCALTWTASEAGTYLIVVSEVGACGASTNTATDNGFPAITCVSSPQTSCLTVDISEHDPHAGLLISPNPSAGIFRISASSPITELMVLDLNGRVITGPKINTIAQGQRTVDMNSVAAGTYLVRASIDGTMITQRVVLLEH